MPEASQIIYTKIDEAPALASHSLLPILRAFTKGSGIELEAWDISLTGRIIANFPDNLTEEQKLPDYLSMSSVLCDDPSANIIKLPNISASIPQLKGALKELQEKGYDIPDYPDEPVTDEQHKLFERFSRVLGSAVNPVLREGNSDRRSATAVKEHGKRNHGSEQAVTISAAGSAVIEFVDLNGRGTVLKSDIPLTAGEIIDCAVMDIRELRAFYAEEMDKAKADGVLLSLHLKSTMMRVSDPIIFGHCVSIFYEDVFKKHAAEMDEIAVNPDNGVAELYTKIRDLTDEKREEIEADIQEVYRVRPELMMVDSNRGITNLHVPSDVIIDATMPVMVRDGGKTWGPDNELHDTVAMIPDRSYATLYQAIIEDCQEHGAFDPATIGSVANVGLMAQRAEEYGSHDKTFQSPGNGTIRVVDASGTTLMEQRAQEGDIFRMCQTKDEPIQDWVKLGVNRARLTGTPAIFWLDPNRVTGNVLRDYLTDLFPILELGTSAKMLSVVPLLKGGGMFETGAGGSAPRHVQQFLQEGHLRWDSLGEFCALVASFEHLGQVFDNDKAKLLAATLDQAIGQHLEHNRAPSRRVNELDTRGSHFYLALYWAEALAKQTQDPELQARFAGVAKQLGDNEDKIVQELNDAQGHPVDIGGYYLPNDDMTAKCMRPSATLNAIVDAL